ncbi:MAG TPA: MFS transporter [Hyphomicrobiaceae bacterium]|nr:MFS transporter [Hyphomicrobiaceae bacterium]
MPLERRILIWMCVLVAINQLGFGAMIPSLPLYAQSFGVPASAIGMAVAAYGLARFFTAIPAGQLSDRFGRRPALAIGGLISAFGNLWCAWATGYPEFIAARFVAGIGAGMIVTTGQVVLADISSPERRGRTIAIYQATFIFSVGIGPFPGGLLAEHFGLPAPFIAYGCASLIAAIVAWFAIHETRGLTTSRSGATAGKLPPLRTQLRLLTSQTGYLLISLIALMNTVVRTGGLFTIIPVLMTARLGLSVSAVGFGMMLGSISGLITAYPAGWLADRFGRKAVIVPATLVSGASMVLFCLAPNYSWYVAACIVWGIAISVGGAAPAAYAADVAPPGMNAAAMSTYRMAGDAGYVIGPLAMGLIVDMAGPTTALLAGAAMLGVVGAAFMLFAPESHPGRFRTKA